MRKYKPATFQPTVRQDWAGILSYISDKEKAEILTAIFKYPTVECSSKFWLETIKPDLDLQYESFTKSCEAKSRGVCNRWGKISITDVEDMYNTCNTDVIDAKSKSKSKSKDKSKEESKKEENTEKIIIGSFIVPTLEEILEYTKQQKELKEFMGLKEAFKWTEEKATAFYFHYAKQDWKLGNGNHMGNWKNGLNDWILNDKNFNKEENELLEPMVCK